MPVRSVRPLLLAATALALTLAGLSAGSPAQASIHSTAASAGVVAAAPEVPASAGPRCGYGSSSGNVQTCITANGSGLHVNYIYVTASLVSSARWLQVCIRGPQGSLGCAPTSSTYDYVKPGYYISFEWEPNSIVPAGDYCANTWRQNTDGSNTQIGHECINVHA